MFIQILRQYITNKIKTLEKKGEKLLANYSSKV